MRSELSHRPLQIPCYVSELNSLMRSGPDRLAPPTIVQWNIGIIVRKQEMPRQKCPSPSGAVHCDAIYARVPGALVLRQK